MYRRILSREKWRWYKQDILLPLAASLAGGLLMKSAWEATGISANVGVLVVIVAAAAFGASFASSGQLIRAVLSRTRKGF